MHILYGRRGAGSAAVEALLAVLGVQHEFRLVAKEADGGLPAWFLKLNPRGEVPTLQLQDGTVMTESAAMMIHLADCYPQSRMAPQLGTPARAQYLRWMVYLAAAPYTSDLRMYYPQRFSTNQEHADAIKAKAIIDLNRDFDFFAANLGTGPFILGQQMTAADIYAAMLLSWSDDFGALMKRLPRLKEIYDAVSANSKIRAVWDVNEMP
jgi:glutathione S-transferase